MAILRFLDSLDSDNKRELSKLFGPAASMQDICLLLDHFLQNIGDEMTDKVSFRQAEGTREPVVSYMTLLFESHQTSCLIGKAKIGGEVWKIELQDSAGLAQKEKWFLLFQERKLIKSISALVDYIQETATQEIHYTVPNSKIIRIVVVPPLPELPESPSLTTG